MRTFDYTVDNEPQQTSEKTLTARQILEAAGLDPTTRILVELRGNNQTKHTDLDAPIHINENLKFITLFNGPTPVS